MTTDSFREQATGTAISPIRIKGHGAGDRELPSLLAASSFSTHTLHGELVPRPDFSAIQLRTAQEASR